MANGRYAVGGEPKIHNTFNVSNQILNPKTSQNHIALEVSRVLGRFLAAEGGWRKGPGFGAARA